MSNITGSINLTQLKHAKMKTPKGAEVIVIPIDENKLILGKEKGGIYLSFQAWELKDKGDRQDTHLIKQSLSKDDYQKLTEEEKRAMPIIGNLKVWGGEHSEPEPNDMNNGKVADSINDLPF